MATDNDQNPDLQAAALNDTAEQIAAEPAMKIDEIDKVIGESDPQFLTKVSSIKINTKVDLNRMQDGPALIDEVSVSNWRQQFKKPFQFRENPKIFVKFWGSLVLIILLMVGTWLNRKSFISEKLFLQSYAELGVEVKEYNPLKETEAFYDNPVFSKNIMTMNRFFANIKESENSGPNPMVVLEINVEGISAEAIIELKDREAEFKDLLLRHLETKNYDELNETKGKQDLCDDFRSLINTHLSQGQVRKVFLNHFVIKP